MQKKNDAKELVVEKEVVLQEVPCFSYPCARCGKTEVIPRVLIERLDLLAPENWCCVAQNGRRTYYCQKCSFEIGVGVL